MEFGHMGASFGRLGTIQEGAAEAPPAGPTPEMQFDDEANSQLLAVLDDF